VSQPDEPQRQASAEEDDEVAPTPFDNPFFLPVILIGFAIWFIYDGWFNPEMEWIKFNRGGAVVTTVLGAYYTWRALKERRAAAGPNRPQAGLPPQNSSSSSSESPKA
jgi:hypothetical protein